MNKNEIENLKQYKDFSEYNCLKEMCRFSEENIYEVDSILKKYEPLYDTETQKGLWSLWGNPKGIDNWVCLEVGSSLDIKSEVKETVKLMVSEPEIVKKDTAFHKCVFDFCTYIDKTSVKCRSIYELCNEFIAFEINVPIYLSQYHKKKNIEKYNLVNYWEVNFAYETQALYWNPAPPTYGNQEVKILQDILEQEKTLH